MQLGDQVIDEGIEQLRTQAVQSRNSVFWLMIALIPTAVLLIASFTFLIARPITQVSEGIRGLGEGQFAKPIRIEGPGDMVRLGAQLDWLRERLVTLEAQKTRFLQHISHELKTPLTALREGSDLLSSGVVGNLNAEQREIARILQENSIELRKLIEGLLNYSAVHAQASYLDAKIVQLRDVVRRVVNDRKLAIVAKGIRIELNCEHVTAYCDEEKIRVVLDNLLSNAVKYSPERGLISIKLYKERGDAVFEVLDEGPGHSAPRAREDLRRFLPRHRRAGRGDQGQRPGPVHREGIRAASQGTDRGAGRPRRAFPHPHPAQERRRRRGGRGVRRACVALARLRLGRLRDGRPRRPLGRSVARGAGLPIECR